MESQVTTEADAQRLIEVACRTQERLKLANDVLSSTTSAEHREEAQKTFDRLSSALNDHLLVAKAAGIEERVLRELDHANPYTRHRGAMNLPTVTDVRTLRDNSVQALTQARASEPLSPLPRVTTPGSTVPNQPPNQWRPGPSAAQSTQSAPTQSHAFYGGGPVHHPNFVRPDGAYRATGTDAINWDIYQTIDYSLDLQTQILQAIGKGAAAAMFAAASHMYAFALGGGPPR